MGDAAGGVRTASADPGLAHISVVAGDVGILALLLLIGSGGLAVTDIWLPGALEGWSEWGVALGVVAISAVVFQIARLMLIWNGHLARKSGAPESVNLFELFAYLVLSHATLAAIVFLSTLPNALGANDLNLSHTERVTADLMQVLVVVAFFVISFVPLLTAFFLQARRGVHERNQRLLRDDVVSPISLFIMLSLFGGIALLAWAAAGRMFEMTSDFGVLVTAVVVIAFIATILAPHIARYWNERSELISARTSAKNSLVPAFAPAKWVSRADSVLVRLVAPLSGATQKHFPHFVLVAVMLPLSALGFVLASPFGLIPIALAMLIVLALGRRWAWLEDDRETASRLQTTLSNDIHIGFENDLKDEALLGYAWLFILVPLALNQLQEWTHSFTPIAGAASGNAFVDWTRFFGAELAKAVPFVDWWEIYNVKVNTPFDARDAAPLAKHLTFVSRALVDLVIMAALLQALSIWQRSRTQQRLYDTGQLDYFDPFTEVAFFETGMQSSSEAGAEPKKAFLERVQSHVEHRAALGMFPAPYSERRLSELIESPNADVRNGAAWMIKKYEILAGTPQRQAAQLLERWLPLSFPRLAAQHTEEAKSRIRREKAEFERVIDELSKTPEAMTDEDVSAIMNLLEHCKEAPEFSYGQLLTYELLGKVPTYRSLLVLALHVLDGDHSQRKPEWPSRMREEMGFPFPKLFLRNVEPRLRVYDALAILGSTPLAEMRVRRLALELLAFMGLEAENEGGPGDRALPGRSRARECAKRVAQSLAN